jgi:hypothetical protein
MAQVVESLPSKPRALSLNSSMEEELGKEGRRRRRENDRQRMLSLLMGKS